MSGDHAEAKIFLSDGIRLADAVNNGEAKAKCLLNLGTLFQFTQPFEAIRYYHEALAIFERIENHLGIGQACDNIGTVYRLTGSYRKAANFTYRASKQFALARQPLAEARCQMNMAHLETDMATLGLEPADRMRSEGRANYERALDTFSRNGAEVDVAACLDALGLLAQDEGRHEQAMELHEGALQILVKKNAIPNLSSVLLHLGNLCRQTGESEKALSYYSEARVLKKKIDDFGGLARIDLAVGTILSSLARYDEAAPLLKGAAEFFRDVTKLAPPNEHGAEQRAHWYDAWKAFLFALARGGSRALDDSEVRTLAKELERSKALPFNLSQDEITVSKASDVRSNFTRELELRRQMSEAANNRVRLRKRLEKGYIQQEEFANRMDEIIRLGQSAFFEWERMVTSADLSGIPEKSLVDAVELLSELTADHNGASRTAVMWFIDFSERESLGIGLTTVDGVSFRVVAVDAETKRRIVTSVEKLKMEQPFDRETLRFHESHLRVLAKELGGLLARASVPEQLERARVRKLVLIPHGLWHHCPWEVASYGGGFLGLQVAIVRNYRATLAHAVQSRGARNVASPVNPSVLVFSPEASLPGSMREGNQVEATFRRAGRPVIAVRGSSASPENFISICQLNQLDVVHFTGHSRFEQADAALSALPFKPQDVADALELTGFEIERSLRFSSKPLVYLNSCQSAMADLKKNDEAYGLTKAFLLAGAGSLVMSAWSVLDSSAADIATEFYKEAINLTTFADALLQARQVVASRAIAGAYGDDAELCHWAPQGQLQLNCCFHIGLRKPYPDFWAFLGPSIVVTVESVKT